MYLSVLANPPSIIFGIITYIVCGLVVTGLARITKTEFPNTKNRLHNIDGLRGLLATGVFIHHFVITYYLHATGEWTAPPTRFYALLGSTCVALFFMITGFLFTQKLAAKDGRINWLSLYISRIFRLVPLYWFAVAVVIAIVFIVGGIELNVPLKSLAKQILYWLTFSEYPNINKFNLTYRIVAGVLWTLKYEWLFYLSLPILAIFIIINKKIPVALWILAGIILWFHFRPYYSETLFVSTNYLIYFLCGGLGASLARNEKLVPFARHYLTSIIAIVSLALAFILFEAEYTFGQAIFLTIFFIPVAMGNSMFGILTTRMLGLLGEISYSVYILHGILLYVAFTLLFPNIMNPGTSLLVFYLLMEISGIALIIITWITYSLIEKPFIDLGIKFSNLIFKRNEAS